MSSNKGDILLKKLQKTIDAWNAEVTDTHRELTTQIGDAKTHLETLKGVLASNKNAPPNQSTRPGPSGAAPTLSERFAPTSSPDEKLQAVTLELEEAQTELTTLRASHEEQAREMKARIYENRANASELEITRKQLEELKPRNEASDSTEVTSLKQQLEEREAELTTSNLEIKSLTSAAKAIRSDSDSTLAIRDRNEAETAADMDTVEAYIDLQSKELGNLKAELHSNARRQEQFAETEEALRGEIESLRAAANDQQQTAMNLQAELEQSASVSQEQQAGLEQAAATSQEQQQTIATLQNELNALKDEYDLLCNGEQDLRAEADSLNQDLKAVRQSEIELREQLASMMSEFERQAEALNESVRELEAHWDLAKEADATENRLAQQVEQLQNELSEESSATIRAHEDLQSAQLQLEQAHNDHAREIEDLRAKKQAEIYSLLKTLGEHGLSQTDTDQAIELTQQRTRIEELALRNDSLRNSLQELEARLAGREESGLYVPATSDDGQSPMPAETEELRAELKAFEESLLQREAVIDAAADKMRMLEETAIAVQEQISELQAVHESAGDQEFSDLKPEAARSEIESLKSNLAKMTERSYTQAARLQEMENELAEAQRRSEQLRSEYEEAAAQSDDVPHLLTQSLAEIDALRDRLAHRDMEIERLKRQSTTPDRSAKTAQMTFAARDADGKTRSMGEILLNAGIITTQQLDSALQEQRSAKKRRLGSILVEKGLIREEIVAQVVGSQLSLPFLRISEQEIERGAIALMDGRLATHHMCFPISATTEQITVAMANPLDLIAIEDLEFATSLKVNPVVATLSDITSSIVKHYGVTIANAIAEDTFESQTPPKLPVKNSTPQTRQER